jgi:hypothetical protein
VIRTIRLIHRGGAGRRRLRRSSLTSPPVRRRVQRSAAKATGAGNIRHTASVPVEVRRRPRPRTTVPAPAGPVTPAAPATSSHRLRRRAPTNGSQPARPQPAAVPRRRASCSWTDCARRSDQRATDHRAAAPSRFHRRTSWRSGRTATRHPTARKQPVCTLARNGSVASGPSRPRRHWTCWSAPA